MWYEVRMHVDDIPWAYNFKVHAYRKARITAERTGYPALVYECSEDGEKLIEVMD